MEQKLQLCVFMLLIHVSHAVWQRVTVKKGETVDLSCPVTNAHQTSIDWKNPEGYVMFFKHNKAVVVKGLQDKRYRMSKLSASEFTVSISGVTFKDGGNYTCSQYGDHITEKIVELTVLDNPKMKRTKDKGRFNIKCISEGNHYPPQISWKLDQGPEILAHSQVVHGDHKYVSRAMLHIQSVESRVTVKCLVRHPALHSQPLMDFVKIGRNPKSHHKTTTNSSAAQGSTTVRQTTTDWFRHGRTTVFPTTRDVNGPSSESTITLSAVPSNQLLPSNEPRTDTTPTGSRVNTAHTSGTSVLSSSTSSNDTINNRTSTTGWTSVSETTEEITFYNHTEGNGTGSFNDPKMQTTGEGSSTLLVFLVTCLIFGLLVVVIFFAIKLRRAHITWKRVFIVTENEDSDPSEESNKSKSSQEEKNSQGQRRRGVLNTAFTQYVVETSPAITSVINTAAMAATKGVNEAQTSQLQTSGQTSARCNIKETEL
uniref:cytotoxic and regulatory T-cell molecule isoform X3 n=1 Tax=Scatophagus argus TaxID=75038 RepID=UPI001ED827AB|nr:cytotoxic and regulatory T-cell molecule isoform X3 [Scatophagus argus]